MKKNILFFLSLIGSYHLVGAEYVSGIKFSRYKDFLGANYESLLFAFQHFEQCNGKFILELGSAKSKKFDSAFWKLSEPENWDWSSGFFTYVAAECLGHTKPLYSIIDIHEKSMRRTKFITRKFGAIFDYHVWDILDFLRYHPCDIHPIDLLYINQVTEKFNEHPAQLQLEIAKMIVKRNYISRTGLIILDCSLNNGDQFKQLLDYFLMYGFKIVYKGPQLILSR